MTTWFQVIYFTREYITSIVQGGHKSLELKGQLSKNVKWLTLHTARITDADGTIADHTKET